jgi:hypothetical protein
MRVLEAGEWGLLLPDEWQADQEDDAIVIGDRDGVGCIEISELYKEDGDFSAEDLALFTAGESVWTPVKLGSFVGFGTQLTEEGAAIREWYLYAQHLLLYVTYSCDIENAGMDDAAVDDILDTLRMVAD